MPNLTVNTVGNGLEGGLGNQLFGVATGLAKGWENDREVFFRSSIRAIDYSKTLFRKLQFRNREDMSEYKNIKEPTPNAMIPELLKPLEKDIDILISGYCQTALYFDRYRERILQMLYLSPGEREIVKKTVRELKGTEKKTVGVHIRTGEDYENLGWALPVEYYKRALEEYGEYNVVIFTDNEEKCKKIFPDKVVYKSTYPDYVELYIMAGMDAFVMSNSSFSWWAVYIGGISDVVAPFPWFRKGYSYNENIYCKGWKKIMVW